MIRAVFLDMDGTIYDYDGCNAISERHLFREAGILLGGSPEEVGKNYVAAKADIKNRLGNVAASHNRLLYIQRLCEIMEKNPIDAGLRLYDTYWNSMLSRMKPYEYVLKLLQYLRGNDIQSGIITDLTAHIQYRKLRKLGLVNWIDVLVTSEEAGVEKPDEKIFQLALQKAGCKPDEAVMVGDDDIRDIQGAEHMEMHTVKFHKEEDMYGKIIKEIDKWM